MNSIVVFSYRHGSPLPPPGYSVVRVDRQSPLGNPFVMFEEKQRGYVCNLYAEMLDHLIENADQTAPAYRAFMKLVERFKAGEDLALGCWCAPKRCHADIIRARILEYANREVKS